MRRILALMLTIGVAQTCAAAGRQPEEMGYRIGRVLTILDNEVKGVVLGNVATQTRGRPTREEMPFCPFKYHGSYYMLMGQNIIVTGNVGGVADGDLVSGYLTYSGIKSYTDHNGATVTMRSYHCAGVLMRVRASDLLYIQPTVVAKPSGVSGQPPYETNWPAAATNWRSGQTDWSAKATNWHPSVDTNYIFLPTKFK